MLALFTLGREALFEDIAEERCKLKGSHLQWIKTLLVLAPLMAVAGCGPQSAVVEPASTLKECRPDDGPVDALCGRVTVFEDRDRAEGRTIDLKIIVYPALSTKPEPDPLFVLVGGPGGSAAQASSQLVTMLSKLQEDRDIVFVDQRGTGDSNGLPCKPNREDIESFTSPEIEITVEEVKKCLGSYDANLRLYTTPIAMDDLDQVRTELGYGKINLWGQSYGTRAASVYLRRHEGNVGTVVLDGVAPVTMKLPLDVPKDGQRALDLMIAACRSRLILLLARGSVVHSNHCSSTQHRVSLLWRESGWLQSSLPG